MNYISTLIIYDTINTIINTVTIYDTIKKMA